MSVLDDLKAKALSEAQSLAPDWLDKGIAAARALLPTDPASTPAGAFRLIGGQALNTVQANKARLAQLGPTLLVIVFSYLAAGDLDSAVSTYLRGQATWSDLFSASKELQEADVQAARARADARAAAVSLLEDVGVDTARAALPLLLAAL